VSIFYITQLFSNLKLPGVNPKVFISLVQVFI